MLGSQTLKHGKGNLVIRKFTMIPLINVINVVTENSLHEECRVLCSRVRRRYVRVGRNGIGVLQIVTFTCRFLGRLLTRRKTGIDTSLSSGNLMHLLMLLLTLSPLTSNGSPRNTFLKSCFPGS